jgi:hypothetical protein
MGGWRAGRVPASLVAPLALCLAVGPGACRSGTSLEGEPDDSASADAVRDDVAPSSDADATPEDDVALPDSTEPDDEGTDDAADDGEAVAPTWPCTAGVPARPCRPVMLPPAAHEMAGRVVVAAIRADGTLGVVSDRTSFARGFDTALAFLMPAPGISSGRPDTIWTFGYQAVAGWTGTEFGVVLTHDEHATSWDLLRVSGDGVATLTATLNAGCNHLLWTGTSWACLFPYLAPFRVREFAPDGTLLVDAPIAIDDVLLDAAWGGGGMGILALESSTGDFSLTVVDVRGVVIGGPTTLDALAGSRSWDSFVLAGSPSGFAVLYLDPLAREVYTSGTTTLQMLRVAVRILFLDASGRPVGVPATVAEALTFDHTGDFGPTPLGAVLSDGEALVAWRDMLVTEDPGSTPPDLRTTSWFRIASATGDGTAAPAADAPLPAYAPDWLTSAPTLARAGRSLALLWSYFCVDDGQDCIAAAMGCCE